MNSKKVSLEVINSSFDSTAKIITSVKSSGLSLESNMILGGIILRGEGPYIIEKNKILCANKLDYSKARNGLIKSNHFLIEKNESDLNECLIRGEDNLEENNYLSQVVKALP